MNREVHVRVWERAEVKFLRATRQNRRLPHRNSNARFTSISRHNVVEFYLRCRAALAEPAIKARGVRDVSR
jgi:hypothetical protein